MSVFGDNNFPTWGKGASSVRRTNALNHVVDFFNRAKPELVYIIPTQGVCTVIPLICAKLEIPYILISPAPKYFEYIPAVERQCLKTGLTRCKSYICLEEDVAGLDDRSDVLQKAYDFSCRASNATVFFSSAENSESLDHNMVMDDLASKSDHLFEVIYDAS